MPIKKYSFIIPVKEINDYVKGSIPKLLSLPRDDFEILIYPDEVAEDVWPETRQIATGAVGPAQKRNLAIRDAKGEILIFIDDDAYPKDDFLEILGKDFEKENIVAVGGPAITPKESNFWQRVSGATFLSSLSGGFPERYRPVGKKKFVVDWPSVNLSIRKNIFEELNGFGGDYWPGEDTKLGFDLLTKKNVMILYDPELVVFHHRREGLVKHVKQISAYGLHRGYFAKKFSRTSLGWRYLMPSLFVIFIIIGGALAFFSKIFLELYIFGWIVYFVALLNAFYDIYRHEKNILITLAASYYIFLTHIFYGLRFLQGLLFTSNLKSKLR
ncbi:MAG: glycosyltransferase [Parcubacteria group bacterium]|jgi:cellulose synthase/poly-beta-1,6-N-acetylglucosamine synthase-like glycosyltransferase